MIVLRSPPNATDIWLLLATCDYGGGVVFVADVAWLVQLRLLPLPVVCRTCSWPFWWLWSLLHSTSPGCDGCQHALQLLQRHHVQPLLGCLHAGSPPPWRACERIDEVVLVRRARRACGSHSRALHAEGFCSLPAAGVKRRRTRSTRSPVHRCPLQEAATATRVCCERARRAAHPRRQSTAVGRTARAARAV